MPGWFGWAWVWAQALALIWAWAWAWGLGAGGTDSTAYTSHTRYARRAWLAPCPLKGDMGCA